MCVHGAFEDTQHFLISCTRYTNLRQELFNVNRVTPMYHTSFNVFLFGSQELSDSDNRQIFLAVQDFLVKSKRFEVI